MECEPSVGGGGKACLPIERLAPSAIPLPSKRLRCHWALPSLGATAATLVVKVTAWPDTMGLAEEVSMLAVAAGGAWLTIIQR